jgi:hypothetical protein
VILKNGRVLRLRQGTRADQKGILLKRIGYLAASLVLDMEDQLVILLVNTMHKDLGSNNVLEVCAALQAACKLINPGTIPAVLDDVIRLLEHKEPIVRKKAVMALQAFFQKAESQITHLTDKIRNSLVDRDPSVMGAALCFLEDLIRKDAPAQANLVSCVPSLPRGGGLLPSRTLCNHRATLVCIAGGFLRLREGPRAQLLPCLC